MDYIFENAQIVTEKSKNNAGILKAYAHRMNENQEKDGRREGEKHA